MKLGTWIATLMLASGLSVPVWAQSKQALQEVEVEQDKSAAADLYVKRRPPVPESPKLPEVLQKRLETVQAAADQKRAEAIELLREFLASKPTGDGRAEGLFKLAELLWEDGRRVYAARMDRWERAVEACRQDAAACEGVGKEPTMDLSESEKLYRTILEQHPGYRRTDLVLYLVGFATREDGRIEEALAIFEKLIREHPRSPLYADAWMMLGENAFALEKWTLARDAYAKVLERESAQAYDLALFKSAWCDWKLGETDRAARRFKRVLDLAREAELSGSERERRRRTQLRDEALDYLVLVFSEDESVTPRDVYDFLASIGGERYSEAVLVKLAEAFHNDAAYERAVAANRFLIEIDTRRFAAAGYQRAIVDAYLAALQGDKALEEIKRLADDYGPSSTWAQANRKGQPQRVSTTIDSIEELVRNTAKGFHARAQRNEEARRQANLALYKRAADTYSYYLGRFGKHTRAVEARFLLAEILFFKMGQTERAGDQYLAVGKSAPVGKYHKDALLKAMAAYKKARPIDADRAGRRELLPVDRKFAEALDLYATLFPADDEIVGVIFENGQLFYDYGDYDEAIKRFGLIITKYPDDPNAGAAGDRILDALNKANDYENIESWARKLKKSKAFSSPEQRQRLDRLIVESLLKSGEKYDGSGDFRKAAGFYLRVPVEYPDHPLAGKAQFNAAVMLEKAKRPEDAGETYLALVDRYPRHELAEKAAFTAGQVYESVAYFERAAEAYELTAKRFPQGEHGADALFNAGVLRQALGQSKRAIDHYETYAKRYRRTQKDAEEVAFRVGVVREEAGDDGRAERSYNDYLQHYRRGAHVIEATTRAGRCAFRLGHNRRASKRFGEAVALWKKLPAAERKAAVEWAAEARYYEGELIYRTYDKVSLDVKPRALDRTLDRKMKLLDQASVVYLDVVEFGDPQWATAALYRIGSVMEGFARALRDAPVPRGLTEEEQQMYRDHLDGEVINIEEKAIELYTVGYQKALSLGVYNRFTRKIREALGRMAASRFPPVNEARDAVRVGDRVPEIPLAREVIRGK